MQASDFIFYIGLGLGFLILFMLKPSKPKHPTPLQMKDFSPKKNYKDKQLPGAKVVKATILEDKDFDLSKEDEVSAWASPTVIVDGKPKDAFSVLNLQPGTPLHQVREHVAIILKQNNSPAKVALIQRAYQAIVDAYNS